MIFIVKDTGKRVMKYSTCFVETHPVLTEIAGSLSTIPFKAKTHDPYPSCTVQNIEKAGTTMAPAFD